MHRAWRANVLTFPPAAAGSFVLRPFTRYNGKRFFRIVLPLSSFSSRLCLRASACEREKEKLYKNCCQNRVELFEKVIKMYLQSKLNFIKPNARVLPNLTRPIAPGPHRSACCLCEVMRQAGVPPPPSPQLSLSLARNEEDPRAGASRATNLFPSSAFPRDSCAAVLIDTRPSHHPADWARASLRKRKKNVLGRHQVFAFYNFRSVWTNADVPRGFAVKLRKGK